MRAGAGSTTTALKGSIPSPLLRRLLNREFESVPLALLVQVCAPPFATRGASWVTLKRFHSDENVCESQRSGFRVGDGSRGRFAPPADFPLQDCSPYRALPVRRECLGFVHR
jgi:hypothetical protein